MSVAIRVAMLIVSLRVANCVAQLSSVCEQLTPCVQCQVFKTGPYSAEECSNCTFSGVRVDLDDYERVELNNTTGSNEGKCVFNDSDNCTAQFKVATALDAHNAKQLTVFVLRVKECHFVKNARKELVSAPFTYVDIMFVWRVRHLIAITEFNDFTCNSVVDIEQSQARVVLTIVIMLLLQQTPRRSAVTTRQQQESGHLHITAVFSAAMEKLTIGGHELSSGRTLRQLSQDARNLESIVLEYSTQIEDDRASLSLDRVIVTPLPAPHISPTGLAAKEALVGGGLVTGNALKAQLLATQGRFSTNIGWIRG